MRVPGELGDPRASFCTVRGGFGWFWAAFGATRGGQKAPRGAHLGPCWSEGGATVTPRGSHEG